MDEDKIYVNLDDNINDSCSLAFGSRLCNKYKT